MSLFSSLFSLLSSLFPIIVLSIISHCPVATLIFQLLVRAPLVGFALLNRFTVAVFIFNSLPLGSQWQVIGFIITQLSRVPRCRIDDHPSAFHRHVPHLPLIRYPATKLPMIDRPALPAPFNPHVHMFTCSISVTQMTVSR